MVKRALKGKKAMVLYYIVIPGFVLGLIMYYIASANSTSSALGEMDFVGQQQLAMLLASQEAEKYLDYMDNAAKLSLQKAVKESAEKGGFENPLCGTYKVSETDKYSIWFERDECVPDYREHILFLMKKNLLEYIKQIPLEQKKKYAVSPEVASALEMSLAIPQDMSYEMSILQDSIVGIADKDLSIFVDLVKKDKSIHLGRYFARPSFKIKIEQPYFEEYSKVLEQAYELTKECSNKNMLEQEECISEKISSFDLEWKEESRLAAVAFSVKSKLDTTEPIVYRFALYFPPLKSS